MTARVSMVALQLQAISMAKADSMPANQYREVQRWADLAGPLFDTSVLSDRTLSRITEIYNNVFQTIWKRPAP